MERIVCPLDSRHTVYAQKLQKHLKICNSRPPKEPPTYINPNLNRGVADIDSNEFELKDIDESELNKVIQLVGQLFEKYFEEDTIEEMFDHTLVLPFEEHKTQTKHVDQVSAILGIAKHFNFLAPNTCFIEFGAGKGELAYYVAKVMEKNEGVNKVLLIDRSTFRHKKDNRIENRDSIHRIKADIADLDLKGLEIAKPCHQFVGLSKHLCGVASDLALRCMVNGNSGGHEPATKGFIIALCCHHRMSYGDFVGREFLEGNGIDSRTFAIMTKITSWCICGSRGKDEMNQNDEILEEKQKIGWKCKRLLDYARKLYIDNNGFNCSLKYYVKSEVTLENVCLIGVKNN